MNEDTHNIIGRLIGLWLALNIIPFLFGVVEIHPIYDSCDTKWAKIEYLIPGFRIGCYLGKPFGE